MRRLQFFAPQEQRFPGLSLGGWEPDVLALTNVDGGTNVLTGGSVRLGSRPETPATLFEQEKQPVN